MEMLATEVAVAENIYLTELAGLATLLPSEGGQPIPPSHNALVETPRRHVQFATLTLKAIREYQCGDHWPDNRDF